MMQIKFPIPSFYRILFSGRSQVGLNPNLPFSSTFPDFNDFSPDFPFNPVFDSNKVSSDQYQPNPYPSEPYHDEPHHHPDRYTPGSSPVIKLRPEYQPEPAYQVSIHQLALMLTSLSTPSHPPLHPLRLSPPWCPHPPTELPPPTLPQLPPMFNQLLRHTLSLLPQRTMLLLDLSSWTSVPMRWRRCSYCHDHPPSLNVQVKSVQPLPITVAETYTGFDCRSKPYQNRHYADPEAGCEVMASCDNRLSFSDVDWWAGHDGLGGTGQQRYAPV